MPPKTLLIRPERDSKVLKPLIESIGYEVVIDPVLNILPTQNALPDLSQIDALIFTSANAVRIFSTLSDSRNFKIFVIGDNTAAEAQNSGFKNIYNANSNIQNLIELINTDSELRYLYVRAKQIRHEIASLCPALKIMEYIGYEAQETQALSPQTVEWLKLGQINIIPFFSKHTAENFVKIINTQDNKKDIFNGLKQTKALCLGPAMVECVQQFCWQDVQIAKRPDREAMLNLLTDITN